MPAIPSIQIHQESDLYLPIIRGGLAQSWPLYRIADGSHGRKPFDIGGADSLGRCVGIEAKVVPLIKLYERMNWTHFELHQRGWLETLSKLHYALALAALWDRDMNELWMFQVCPDTIAKPLGEWPRWKMDAHQIGKIKLFVNFHIILRDTMPVDLR